MRLRIMERDKLMRHGVFLGALALAAVVVGINSVFDFAPASAEETTQTRAIAPFTRIEAAGAMDITIRAGEDQRVAVTTAQDRLADVTTTVEDGTLLIEMEKGSWRRTGLSVDIAMDRLDGLVISGAADIEATGVDSDELELVVNGAGDVTISGACGTARVTVNGAGDLQARRLECRSATVIVRGAGDAVVYASRSVDVNIAGVGSVDVYGKPDQVERTIAGLGDLEVK